MKLILNESKVVQDIFNGTYIEKGKGTQALYILAKHYFKIGMSKEQVRDNLEVYANKACKDITPINIDKKVKNALSHGKRCKDKVNDISKINITIKELEVIRNIEKKDLQILAFVTLVYAKIFNIQNNVDTYWVNEKDSEIFKDCKIKVSSEKQGKMLHELKEMGLLAMSKKVNLCNHRVLYGDENSEIAIVVRDFNNISYEYLRWLGEKIKECECCGQLIRMRSNNVKYCKECAKRVKNEMVLEIKKKKRKDG